MVLQYKHIHRYRTQLVLNFSLKLIKCLSTVDVWFLSIIL